MNEHASMVLCIGAVMVDLVCHVPSLPSSGEGIVAQSSEAAAGGCAFNSACAIKELGLPVGLFAPLGTGLYADYLRARLTDRGLAGVDVDASFDNGVCLCLIEQDGERTMLTIPGVDRHYERSWFDRIDASNYAAAVVSGYEIEPPEGDAIISFLEDNPHLRVYFGPGPRIGGLSREKLERINALRPVWHLNDQEARAFTGLDSLDEAGKALLAACENAVVVTEGAAGARVFTSEGTLVVSTAPVRVVDTVGAGDAHIGVVAALRSSGASWKDAVRTANVVAGVVCGQSGAPLRPGALAGVL